MKKRERKQQFISPKQFQKLRPKFTWEITQESIKETMTEVMFLLHDKEAFTKERMDQFCKQINEFASNTTDYKKDLQWVFDHGFAYPMIAFPPIPDGNIPENIIKQHRKISKKNMKHMLYLFCIQILHNEFDYTEPQLRQFQTELDALRCSIEGQYLSHKDMRDVLKDESGIRKIQIV